MEKWKIILMCVLISFAAVFFVGLVEEDREAERKTLVHSNPLPLSEESSYYMKSQGSSIIVYNKDHTVYEYTDLQKEFLPEHVVYELIQGIYFQDQEDLYEFLETYSS